MACTNISKLVKPKTDESVFCIEEIQDRSFPTNLDTPNTMKATKGANKPQKRFSENIVYMLVHMLAAWGRGGAWPEGELSTDLFFRRVIHFKHLLEVDTFKSPFLFFDIYIYIYIWVYSRFGSVGFWWLQQGFKDETMFWGGFKFEDLQKYE